MADINLVLSGCSLVISIFSVVYAERCKEKVVQLEAQLARESFKHSHVFVKTAEVVETIYKDLVELRRLANAHESILPTMHVERGVVLRNFKEKSDAFWDYFLPKKLFVSPHTAEKILEFYRLVKWNDPLSPSSMVIRKHQQTETPWKTFEEAMLKSMSKYAEIEELLTFLERDFQKTLGFPIEKKSI